MPLRKCWKKPDCVLLECKVTLSGRSLNWEATRFFYLKMRPFVIALFTWLMAGLGLLLLAGTATFFIGTPEQMTPAFALRTIAARFLVIGLIALMFSGIFNLGARFFPQDKVLAFFASRRALLGALVISALLLAGIWGPEILITR